MPKQQKSKNTENQETHPVCLCGQSKQKPFCDGTHRCHEHETQGCCQTE